jgi:hypothetical protein
MCSHLLRMLWLMGRWCLLLQAAVAGVKSAAEPGSYVWVASGLQ